MSNIKVCKFGGTSNADARSIEKVVKIIKNDETRRYVVVSAPGKRIPSEEKVTDLLYKCCDEFSDTGAIKYNFGIIRQRFIEIVRDLQLDLDIESNLNVTEKEMLASKCDRAFCASRGEYLNAIIIAKKLGFNFVDAKDIIKFNENGVFEAEYTNDITKQALSKIKNAVIPGFYGKKPDGTIATFSRGGSDITGAIIARAVGAEIYENWTDVDGMLVTDPRIVKGAKNIGVLSYKELRELAYMGASVLHEDAIFPVSSSEIPINIRNTFNPSHSGTMIVPLSKFGGVQTTVTGIAGSKGYSAIYIEKAMANSETGFIRKILSVLERYNVSVEHLPTGIDTMSIVVETKSLEGIREILIEKIAGVSSCDSIHIVDNLAVIAIVGHGMHRKKGLASRLFSAIYKADINIMMIDQGSCEINIIVGIEATDYEKCVSAIYDEFFLTD